MFSDPLIPPHGGYRELKSYQMAEIVHDATVVFCDRFIDKRSRTCGSYFSSHGEREGKAPTALPVEGATQAPVMAQMIQAARSGKQNIAQGSMASGTSYQFAFIHITSLTSSSVPRRTKMYACVASFSSPRSIFESELVSNNRRFKLVGVARASLEELNYLLDRQLRALEKGFLEEGGFTERLYRVRSQRGTWKKL